MMNFPLVPNNAFGYEGGLLTALVIGFLFGFALERAGFGNAKKLSAQFYLYDMTVFKVMFSAIITAMAGLFAFDAFGWVNLDLVWINPTFFWPQLIGGFLLGVGFIISGLCPGTGFVSMASGKTDAFFAIGGVFIGTLIFGIALDAVPALGDFYNAPAAGRILLHNLLGLPAPVVALLVVLMALGCFIGAEKLEAVFARKFTADDDIERSNVADSKGKFMLAGGLAAVCVLAMLAGPKEATTGPAAQITNMQPLELAELLISREAGVTMLDLRSNLADDAVRVPGAIPVDLTEGVPAYVSGAAAGATLVLISDEGVEGTVPEGWPARNYSWLKGGIKAWQDEVLKPVQPVNFTSEELDFVRKQNQIAAYYSGAKVEAAAAPPPPAASGGKKKKKAAGGC